jgi:preprotein translocase subunit SecA
MRPNAERINALEPEMEALDDDGLRRRLGGLRERADKGESLDELLPETFAIVREAARRAIGQRHYDVQLIGGQILHEGMIAEMKTGEGKTLVSTLPAVLNALTGRGVHIVTVNDYLARFHAEWMGKIYAQLGMSVGCIVAGIDEEERRAAYASDITYGQNNEFGFDYLRDNMKPSLELYVQQRGHHFAIVDEVDSILIDEARTPLIISGPVDDDPEKFRQVAKLAPRLTPEVDYTVDEKARQVSLTDDGVVHVEKLLGVDNLYAPEHMDTLHVVQNAIRAHALYQNDVHYVVKDGQIVIVDEFTGRLMEGRRWSDGLHQSVEAKEGVKVQNESQTYASITFQNYFRMYEKLSGMTGTADTEAEEFAKIYNLNVVVAPTNRPMIRDDAEDLVYRSKGEKWGAVTEAIRECHEKGQPVLVGTIAIETSEMLSKRLKNKGVPHNVLNAKHHGNEAGIIAQAGRHAAVTISTNMAGRGTDIILGGNAEMMLRARGLDPNDSENAAVLAEIEAQCQLEREQVLAAGGLHVLGTERHESRRIDNQLRGRSGRQGDPGSSRFYLSLEDDLLRIFGSERIQGLMTRLGMEEGEAIEAKMLSGAIERAQRKVEARNFDVRKHLLEYDDVMNRQRETIYAWRREALASDDIGEEYTHLAGGLIQELAGERVPDRGESDVEGLVADMEQLFAVVVAPDDPVLYPANRSPANEAVVEHLRELAAQRLQQQAAMFEELGQRFADLDIVPPSMNDIGRGLLLQTLDELWKEHLLAMDHLKEGIGLRGYGGADPKREYQKEGYQMFIDMERRIRERACEQMFHIVLKAPSDENVRTLRSVQEARRTQRERALQEQHASASTVAGPQPDEAAPQQTVQRDGRKIGRNEACPCGSGKKYKRCCGAS